MEMGREEGKGEKPFQMFSQLYILLLKLCTRKVEYSLGIECRNVTSQSLLWRRVFVNEIQ